MSKKTSAANDSIVGSYAPEPLPRRLRSPRWAACLHPRWRDDPRSVAGHSRRFDGRLYFRSTPIIGRARPALLVRFVPISDMPVFLIKRPLGSPYSSATDFDRLYRKSQ